MECVLLKLEDLIGLVGVSERTVVRRQRRSWVVVGAEGGARMSWKRYQMILALRVEAEWLCHSLRLLRLWAAVLSEAEK